MKVTSMLEATLKCLQMNDVMKIWIFKRTTINQLPHTNDQDNCADNIKLRIIG